MIFPRLVKGTGKSLSEAFIFASTNPQYDERLFIELQGQLKKIPSSEHVVYINKNIGSKNPVQTRKKNTIHQS